MTHEPDDTDMTEDDINQATATGTPVERAPVTIIDPEYLLQQYAYAIARYDCDELSTAVPDESHPMWQSWRGEAQAVLKVRDRHLDQLRQRLELAATGLKNPPPRADYISVWTELTGWVTAAHEDGDQIDPAELLDYMRELRHRALAPVREWMNGIVREGEEA